MELTAQEEGRTPAYAAMIGGRSLKVEAGVDCRAGLVFVHHLAVHAGPGLSGPVTTELTGTGWRPAAPRSTAERLLEAGCGARAVAALRRRGPPPPAVSVVPAHAAPPELRPTLGAPAALAVRTTAPPRPAATSAVAAAPTPVPAVTSLATPAAFALQVGAANSSAEAQGLLDRLPARFKALAALRPGVEPATVNGRRVFRALFMASDRRAAAALCRRLAAAGQACFLRPPQSADGVTRPG